MESNDGDSVLELSNSSNVLYEKSVEINGEEKFVVDEAERKLDKLEGFIGRDKEDVCLIFEEDGELEFKVHNTLRRDAEYWSETGGRKIEKERWMTKRIGDWKGSMVEERKEIRE